MLICNIDPRHGFYMPPKSTISHYEPTSPSPSSPGVIRVWDEYAPPAPPRIQAAPKTKLKQQAATLKRKAEDLESERVKIVRREEAVEASEKKLAEKERILVLKEKALKVKEVWLGLEKEIKESKERQSDD
jgi:hypothetical protein